MVSLAKILLGVLLGVLLDDNVILDRTTMYIVHTVHTLKLDL